ncbi:MAG: zinc ribbon domain-containing protein [Ruminococcus sp.]|jgi:hypothetical protein|nr:zinc ribbon domain-containing protein [Ruminococcus sp.]
MICPKCNSEITEDTDFCGICGAKLADFEDGGADLNIDSHSKSNRQIRQERRKALRKKLMSRIKLAAGVLAVIAVAVIAILIVSSLKRSEGERIFAHVPLGRNVEIADKETGVTFEVYSEYEILSKINAYSYVCEADSSVTVEGIALPEWAVLLTKNSQNNISRVSYYEFAALRSSWKGYRKDTKISLTDVTYGQKISDVEKMLKMSPYAMIATLDNNTTECIFRYNAPDEDGNSRVYNLSVFIDDADDTVKDVSESELDYIGFFLSAN